jgi:predicted phage replisome organizer
MAHGNEINNKRYYWFKLNKNFFKNVRIKKLRHIAGGDTYTIIYLKLILLTLDNDSIYVYEHVYDTVEEEIANKIDEKKDDVAVLLKYLASQNMVEERDDGDFFLPEGKEGVGSESQNWLYKKNNPKRLDKIQPNSNQNPIEIDKELDIEIEQDKEIDKDTTPSQAEPLNLSEYVKTLSKYYIHDQSLSDLDLSVYAKDCHDLINEYGKDNFDRALSGFIRDGNYQLIRNKHIFFRKRMQDVLSGKYIFKKETDTSGLPISKERIIELLTPLKKACNDAGYDFDIDKLAESMDGVSEEVAKRNIANAMPDKDGSL